jgi:hypothetical protein
MIMYRLAVMACPVQLCRVSWGFTPADPARYWIGKRSTHDAIMAHVAKDHPYGKADVMAQISVQEEAWWGLEQVEIP